MYVIIKTDSPERSKYKKGFFVSKLGSAESYTPDILKARIFKTSKEAEKNCCEENEIVKSVCEILSNNY